MKKENSEIGKYNIPSERRRTENDKKRKKNIQTERKGRERIKRIGRRTYMLRENEKR